MGIFKKPWFLPLIALLFIALVIWFIGPYISIGDYQPFGSILGRFIGILAVVGIWLVVKLVKKLLGQKKGDKLVANVAAQEDPSSAKGAADAKQLRERFEEAIGALRKSKGGRLNLYDLPWYMIIGPPGSGKTTVIVNSGLKFPLSQKFGKEALRGVGGTRNCDWWFTDQAIMLDTAGRYTTQDSDEKSDAAGWHEFLTLLRKFRKRRPINGVIVAMSMTDLLAASEVDRRKHVAAIQKRLDELSKELRISLPVYVMFTKTDLLAGFTEFFDDLVQENRAQVWGTTYPIEASRSGQAPERFAAGFDELVARLDARAMTRLEGERDVQRRALIFGFPRQFAATRRTTTEFVEEIFGADGFQGKVLLRGVYFTSGTQEGTPMDRLLGVLARNFGLGVAAMAPQQPGRGKAFFIQRLLNEVLFKETGIAGVDRRMEIRQGLAQAAAYIGVLLVTILGVIWMSVSYSRNKEYLTVVQKAAEPLALVGKAASPDLTAGMDRLNALRGVVDVAESFVGDVPLAMRAGLYQGNAMGQSARNAYLAELNSTLAPAIAIHFHDRLIALNAEPDKLYEYLKAYLMLGDPSHLDAEQLKFVTDVEWAQQYSDDDITRQQLSAHVAALVANTDRVQPVTLDKEVVDRARISLRSASLPVLILSRLRLGYVNDPRALDLGTELGLTGADVFTRSGKDLDEKFPALYTRRVFEEVAVSGKLTAVNDFVSDSWVLGEGTASRADVPRLAAELMSTYEDAYIRAWEELIGELQAKSASNERDMADLMALVASPTSPLRNLLLVIDTNTNFAKPLKAEDASDAAKQSVAARAEQKLESIFTGAKQVEKPGTRITRRFAQYHKLVEGQPGAMPIDSTLRAIGTVRQLIQASAPGVGSTGIDPAANRQVQDAVVQLKVEAKQLPPTLSKLVEDIAQQSQKTSERSTNAVLANSYRSEVAAQCSQLLGRRYPFAVSTADVGLADFSQVFGYNGLFDQFYRTKLAQYVDNSRSVWRWQEGAALIGAGVSLPLFQRVEEIRQIYFRPGGTNPEVRFNLTPESLDANVRRLAIDIEGQLVEYRHGPQRTVPIVWPGPNPGRASILFEESGGSGPNKAYSGTWALFRLLEQAQVVPQSDGRTYAVTFSVNGRTARLTLEASSARNPFRGTGLRSFGCGG
jgi:type VI secretion system protein ImpL